MSDTLQRNRGGHPRAYCESMHISTQLVEGEVDHCFCQIAECGFVDSEQVKRECAFHGPRMIQPVRQMHWASECPDREGVWP